MKISKATNQPIFRADLSKDVMLMLSRAKGSCPLHKKPMLNEAIKTIKKLYPKGMISKNNDEIYLSFRDNKGVYQLSRHLSQNVGDKVEDIRSIAAGLEWIKIGANRFFPPTAEQKVQIDNFLKKWGNFYKKYSDKRTDIKFYR